MRVGVALDAGERLKSIRGGPLAAGRNFCLVAFGAGNRNMAARQREGRSLMPRQREGRGLKAVYRVAVLTLVIVRSAGKLPFVGIGVAILTSRLLDFVDSFHTSGDVALVAGHLGVHALQGIVCCRVLLGPKGRGLESVNGMASHAVAAVFSCGELAAVWVLVAVHAPGESDWLFKVSAVMALRALNIGMFADEGILCSGVVELGAHFGLRNSLPTRRRMAGFTSGLECSVMRIAVAVRALAERNSHELHQLRILGLGLMALLARDAGMLTRQCEPGLGMVKMADFLPVVEVMTLFALVAQSPLVRILVTGGAGTRQAEESAIQVLIVQLDALARADVLGNVALLAGEPSVFPF
jgi:hypothetical protein